MPYLHLLGLRSTCSSVTVLFTTFSFVFAANADVIRLHFASTITAQTDERVPPQNRTRARMHLPLGRDYLPPFSPQLIVNLLNRLASGFDPEDEVGETC